MAVADWMTYALFKLYATLNKDHLFTHVHRCTEDVTHFIRNVFMHRQALLRNQIDFCNAPRKARLYGTIKYIIIDTSVQFIIEPINFDGYLNASKTALKRSNPASNHFHKKTAHKV